MHEKILANTINRPIKEITDEEVKKKVLECDQNQDGLISKSEMQDWIA